MRVVMKQVIMRPGETFANLKVISVVGPEVTIEINYSGEKKVAPVVEQKKRKTSYRGKNLGPDGHSVASYMVHVLQENGGKIHLDRMKKRISEFWKSTSWSGPLSHLRMNGVINHDEDGMLTLLKSNLTQNEVKEIVREHNRQVKAGLK